MAEGTRKQHAVALKRVTKNLGTVPIDQLTVAQLAEAVAAWAADGLKRETIAKSLTALGLTLER